MYKINLKNALKTFLVLSICLFFENAYSQTAKGYWLAGGQAAFSSDRNDDGGTVLNRKIFQASPMSGYFFINNLAGGLRTSFRYTHLSSSENYTSFSAGPFVRGYFLPVERKVNLFAQADYMYENQVKANIYSVNAGPVIYFHDNVGIEFTVGYSVSAYKGTPAQYRTLQSGIGLQIHLNKD
ncbi:hypothetical protein [Daejeonella sp.]|uniref:hypothetical protein n=1 Tax=Daejeonella sp. TaxID=2805397 RepID=UPI0030BE3BC8